MKEKNYKRGNKKKRREKEWKLNILVLEIAVGLKIDTKKSNGRICFSGSSSLASITTSIIFIILCSVK